MKFEAPRGTQDLLPGEQPVREAIVEVAKDVATRHGYHRVITPTFEDTALFARTAGETSDVVQKEMYSFQDRSERWLTLRPEGTASVARAYLEHGLGRGPQPVKLYYISPMFRYSRMQRGRYREFWQIGLEALGSEDPLLDAELIAMFRQMSRRLNVGRVRLELNSIGDQRCRPAYVELLQAFLRKNFRRLDEESQDRVEANPLRVFDTKSRETQAVLEAAPLIVDHLCASCRDHFAEVRSYLNALGIRPHLNPRLVRGLDYYTRTVWEFVNPALGSQGAICAGGRYDGLIEELGGPRTPGVGWAAGIERMALSIAERHRPPLARPDIFFVFEDPRRRKDLLPMIERLRQEWICELDYLSRSPRKQFQDAVRRRARVIAIVKPGRDIVLRHFNEEKLVRSESGLLKNLYRLLK